MEEVIRAAVNVQMDSILRLMYEDPHQWSNRPCNTCRAITAILGKPFGCYEYQQRLKDRPKAKPIGMTI